MASPDTGQPVIRYVGYDTKTGRIVHTHSQLNVQDGRHADIPADELVAQFSADPVIVERVTDHDPANLAYIRADDALDGSQLMVDTASRRLVPQPRLVLSADKTELAGDGQDSARLSIQLVGGDGQPVGEADGLVKVRTTRGKLSARGGLVTLADGHGDITLTSANETVSQVRVTVTAVDQTYAPARLDLEFG
jgi:hypothetical protein